MLFLQGSYKRWWNVSEGTQVGQGSEDGQRSYRGIYWCLAWTACIFFFFGGVTS
jgi:hypothetical protein